MRFRPLGRAFSSYGIARPGSTFCLGDIMVGGQDFMHERISINPNVCHGQACIKGTRIPVHQIVKMMANGDTIEELLEAYPSLKRADILAALQYAGELAEELVSPLESIDQAP